MSARHRRPVPPRTVNRRVVGAGAAGLATVFAVSPLAYADSAGTASADAPTTSGATTSAPTHTTAAPAAKPAAPKAATKAAPKTTARTAAPSTRSAFVEPNYGSQKIRVGVRIKSGAYVPVRTTVGSEITLVDTDQQGNAVTWTCNTEAGTVDNADVDKTSFCTYLGFHTDRGTFKSAAAKPAVVKEPGASSNDLDYFYLEPGHSLTINQTGAEPNLLIDPDTVTVGPCVNPIVNIDRKPAAAAADELPTCPGSTDRPQYVFIDPGLPPSAVDDSATTKVATPVDLDVLANDSNGVEGAPVTGLTVTKDSAHGTTSVHAPVSASIRTAKTTGTPPRIVTYTPKPGFVGTDHFTYRFQTPNGVASAVATIVVVPPPPAAVDDARTTPYNTPVTVAVTGNDDANGGGALTVTKAGKPAHGTVAIVGTSVRYTPDTNYSGVDRFPYTIATKYGTASAVVTITIDPPAHADDNNNLPDTGVPTTALAEYSLGLLLTGGAVSVAGRRRRRGRHAD